jgi:hypothetical protein
VDRVVAPWGYRCRTQLSLEYGGGHSRKRSA